MTSETRDKSSARYEEPVSYHRIRCRVCVVALFERSSRRNNATTQTRHHLTPAHAATAIIRPNATACALAGAFMSLIHDGSARPLAITMTALALTGLLLQRWLARNPSAP